MLIAFAPIFLANLVFTQRVRDVGDSTVAFVANLLGAMACGVIEYVSLITGYPGAADHPGRPVRPRFPDRTSAPQGS